MDTLGTISPKISEKDEPNTRREAVERMRYLALTHRNGALTGESGSGKSRLLSELAVELHREGLQVVRLNLAGVSGSELPYLMGTQLRLDTNSTTHSIEQWRALQEVAESLQLAQRKIVFLLDHADQADLSAVPPLLRLMGVFERGCSWILASRELSSSSPYQPLLQRAWLQIRTSPLEKTEAARVLSRALLSQPHSVRVNQKGVDAAFEISQGKMEHVQRIAELTSVAVEADQLTEVSDTLIRELTRELIV